MKIAILSPIYPTRTVRNCSTPVVHYFAKEWQAMGHQVEVFNVKSRYPDILFKGKLPHDDIPTYLNAADAFVLPTLHEGCCNAVVEGMACGLPIISSNRPFNWDVLDETNSIMIDPESVEEIRNAIVELRDNPERRDQLSIGALEKAKDLTIGKRASKIAEFIQSRI